MFKKYLLVTLVSSILSPHILAMPMVYTFSGSSFEFSVLTDLDQYDPPPQPGTYVDVETPVWLMSYNVFFHDDIGETYNVNPENDIPTGYASLSYTSDPNNEETLIRFALQARRGNMHVETGAFTPYSPYSGPAGGLEVGTRMYDATLYLSDYWDEDWYQRGSFWGAGSQVTSVMTLSEYYASVPEPGTLPLLFGGLMILVTVKKKNLWHKKTVFNRLSIRQRFA
jgi:hypothetical protein